jgi:hypothetical protein
LHITHIDRADINWQVVVRNTLRQPSFFNLDLRLLKAFSLGETWRLAFANRAALNNIN